MSYLAQLQQHNTDLQGLIDKANALPDAESSDPILQDKTVTPTTSAQTITADDNYDGLGTVTVNAMPTATQATPSISVNSSGLITASATQAAGYVTAGTKSGTKQLTTQAAKTVTPTTSSQTAVASGRYTTGAITVAAIPSNYEDVGTETSAYTTKLASLENAITALETELEGKASGGSGGGSVETCTVSFTTTTTRGFNRYGATIYANGIISSVIDNAQNADTVIITDAVKGSSVTIVFNNYVVDGITATNATLIDSMVFDIEGQTCIFFKVDS